MQYLAAEAWVLARKSYTRFRCLGSATYFKWSFLRFLLRWTSKAYPEHMAINYSWMQTSQQNDCTKGPLTRSHCSEVSLKSRKTLDPVTVTLRKANPPRAILRLVFKATYWCFRESGGADPYNNPYMIPIYSPIMVPYSLPTPP